MKRAIAKSGTLTRQQKETMTTTTIKTMRLAVVCTFVLLCGAGRLPADTINFTAFADHTSLSNYDGVAFSTFGGPGAPGAPVTVTTPAYFGGPGGLTNSSNYAPSGFTSGYPTSSILQFQFAAPVGNVSFNFNNEGDSGSFYDAYNSQGHLLQSGSIGSFQGGLVSLSAAGISTLQLNNDTGGRSSWAFAVPTLSFTYDGRAPTITSAAGTAFTVGSYSAFTVTDTGVPTPTLSESGALPSGVFFNPSNGLLSGTPGAGTGGIYDLTFYANNGVNPEAVQSFVLTDYQAPAITSAASDTFAGGLFNSFTVTDTGFPNATLSESGALPAGVTFNPLTGLLSGTPAAVGGNYFLTFYANNGVNPEAIQSFELTVTPEPSSVALLCTGIGMGVVVVRRRRKAVID